LSLYAQYAALLDEVLDELVSDGTLPADLDRRNVTVEPPRDPSRKRSSQSSKLYLPSLRLKSPDRASSTFD